MTTHLANALLVHAEGPQGQAIHESLHRNSYVGPWETMGEAALKTARELHPDIILVGAVLDSMDGLELVRALKADSLTSEIPVVLLGDENDPDLGVRAREAGADDILSPPLGEAVLAARIRPLVRVATMHAELSQRVAVAQAFGKKADASPQTDDDPAVMLLVGDEDDEVGLLTHALASLGRVTRCANLYEAEDLMARQNFDAALVPVGGVLDVALDFCAHIRHNPRLFNLPVILLSDGPLASKMVIEAYHSGASRVLPRQSSERALRTAVGFLVRRQKLRWAIRKALERTLLPAYTDPMTGGYDRAFLTRHLDARIGIAQRQNKHLSVVFFYVPSIGSVRNQFGEDAARHLLQQISQWIGSLVRAEDLVALFQGHEFCAVLPDTPLEEAEVVMHRIAGVLAYTDFAVRDVYQPVKVWVQVGATAVKAGDTVDTVVARARNNLT